MSKANKILLGLVIVLFLVLIGLIVWQKWGFKPPYSAVYLRTGDLYFGRLTHFPSFGLRDVYTIQINQQNQQNPISIQKFADAFWGPEDYLKINRNEVVWTTKLRNDGQLAQLLKTNPALQPAPTGPAVLPQNLPQNPQGEENRDSNSGSGAEE